MSIGCGLACAGATVTVLLYFSVVLGMATGLSSGAAVTMSLMVGVTAATILWFAFTFYDREFRRMVGYVEGLAQVEDRRRSGVGAWKMGLESIANAAEGAVDALKRQVDAMRQQRRELEIQVRVSEAERRHAEEIFSSISDAVIVTDTHNDLAMINESALQLLAIDAIEALRRPIDQVLEDPALVKLIKDMRETAAESADKQGLCRHVEHQINQVADPQIYDVTLTCLPGGDGRIEPSGVVTVLRDITRQKEISEMKSDFVSNVSHELRTPLSSIQAYVEMLIDGEASDEQTRSEFYNIVQGEANRLSRLIDNILNIGRIESGVMKVQREFVSLYGVVKEAADMMKPQSRAKGIALDFHAPPLRIDVFADKDMMYQATVNLISNAIKYTPDQGSVTVTIEVIQERKEAVVSVSDTGVGIGEQDLPHVFDKFYRVTDHKHLAKGTGLGLNLVQQIIETIHGGKLEVESRVGQGSTFRFVLPLAEHGY